jgi:hypothetical protein
VNTPDSKRRWVRLEAEVVSAEDFERVGGRIVEIGAEGASIELEQRVVTGETLFVSFELPGVGVVDAEAVASARSGRVVAVQWSIIEDEVRSALSGRLSKLPPVLPRPSESGDTYPAIQRARASASA